MNTQKGRFPDFLIIGAMKAGTTSLHDYLGKHPDIFTTDPKEIHFFLDSIYNNKSTEWYKSHFITNKKIAGTSPQNYTKCHTKDCKNVPERIYKHIPDIKLIYLIRNPVDRIYSHYREAQEGGYDPPEGLNRFLSNYKNNHYIQTSRYFFQISKYLEYFSKKQILIIKSENLKTNRLNTLNKIFDFLNVEKMTDPSLFEYSKNTAKTKQRKTTFGKIIVNKNLQFLRNIIPENMKTKLKNSYFINSLSKKNLKHETIEESLKNEITNYLKEDIVKLEAFSGINLSDYYNYEQ